MPVLLILHIVAWIGVAVFMRPGIFMALAFISGCAAYFLAAEAIAPLFHGDTITGQIIGPEYPDQQRAWYYLYWLLSPLVFWVAIVYRLPSQQGTAVEQAEPSADDSAELERLKKAWGYFWR